MGDLPATAEDAVKAVHAANCFGVPDENIRKFSNIKLSDARDIFMDATARLTSLSNDKKRVFLMVYMAGHGVADMT